MPYFRGESPQRRRAATRLLVICDSAQAEGTVADRLADLVADDGVVVEQLSRPLRHRRSQRRLSVQLCQHRHLGRRVLLLRRWEQLESGEIRRLASWLNEGRAHAEWQVLTLRTYACDDFESSARLIESEWQPDWVVSIGRDPAGVGSVAGPFGASI